MKYFDLNRSSILFLLLGAAGSLAFTLYVGHRNRSVFLLGLFAIWVVSPFVGLLVAIMFPNRWTAQRMQGALALILGAASLVIYGMVAFGPPRPRIAGPFLVVPLASWLLIGIAVLIASQRKRPHGTNE